MPEKEAKKRDYFIQFGMAAAIQAIQRFKIRVTDANASPHRVCSIGSGIGEFALASKNITMF